MTPKSTIHLSRTSQLSALLRSFTVTLDGRNIGTIAAGKSIEIAADPGPHTIQCSMYGAQTASMEFNVRPDQAEFLECGISQGFFQLLLYLRTARPIDAPAQTRSSTPRPWWQAALIHSALILCVTAGLAALLALGLYLAPALRPSSETLGFLLGLFAGASIGLCFLVNYISRHGL